MTPSKLIGFGLGLAALALSGCAGTSARPKQADLAEVRSEALAEADGELAGKWLLRELVSPGGTPSGVSRARQRLEQVGPKDTYGYLARGIDDMLHGRLRAVSDHFLAAAQAARASADPHADLLAWYAIHHARQFRREDPTLWTRWHDFVAKAIETPGHLGWRARSELVEWWSDEEYDRATRQLNERSAARFGCIKGVRLAGPFGTNSAEDAFASFPAEKPGPWPLRWQPSAGIGETPRVLKVKQLGCHALVDEASNPGIYYAESFVDVPKGGEFILAVQGALAVWVNDHKVLDRDVREWGVWPRFGVRVKVAAGRQRILARLTDPKTSLRILEVDGRPANLRSDADPTRPYSLLAPKVVEHANALDAFLKHGNVVAPEDDILRYVAAHVADFEDQGDIASVLIEPLVSDRRAATGPALAAAAMFIKTDPIFDSTQTRDLMRTLFELAEAKDKNLWATRLSLALSEQERKSPLEAVAQVRKLVNEFPQAPAVLMALSRLYGELGWSPEHKAVVEQLLVRFPQETAVLYAGIELYDSRGQTAEAENLVKRVMELDPDSEIVLERAMARRDYAAALQELRRVAERRPERKDIAERIQDALIRSGSQPETWKKLEAAIERDPRDGDSWLRLADARYAASKPGALQETLVDAVLHGAPTQKLTAALDLVEGSSELEPYRLDALPIIAAYERGGRQMPGTAARVLDYAAAVVHSDGSSRMLEHEIIRIQSAEGISAFAEHNRLPGLTLRMRVIKPNGRILEPEFISGKPTVTFPHLEIGDYIETEQIVSQRGDGQHGMHYQGPRWFFREANVAYARSEFVIVTPKEKKLVIETYNDVPEPEVTENGSSVTRRWRVDFSPAATPEPNSAPASEFLPSVQTGWGITLEESLRALAASIADVTPVDPRIVTIAKGIVKGVPSGARQAQAQRLYRWVLDKVEQGEEKDGRRVVVGKNGNRWRAFVTLCRALNIPADYAVAKNRLAAPAQGPISEASLYNQPLLRVGTEHGPVWLTIGNKYSPFGYLPAELRNVPAYQLGQSTPVRLQTPASGDLDGVSYEGSVVLKADGSARVELTQSFFGKYGAALRSGLAGLPKDRIHDAIESRLVARALRGARLVRYRLEHMDDFEKPLTIKMTLDASSFAQESGGQWIVTSPFSAEIGQLATLPVRLTPMLLTDSTYQTVKLTVSLPKGFRAARAPEPVTLVDGDRSVSIKDVVHGATLVLDRVINLPAGRIQPKDYSKFVDFARNADDHLATGIRVSR